MVYNNIFNKIVSAHIRYGRAALEVRFAKEVEHSKQETSFMINQNGLKIQSGMYLTTN